MATRIKSSQIADGAIVAADLHSAIAINTTQSGTFGSVIVDNYTLGSNRISTNQANSYNGDIMLDAAGKIILDTDVGNVQLKDNGQTYAEIERSSGNVIFYGAEQDKNIQFKGNVSGTATTALTLDFANSGRATFSENVITTGTLAVNGATMGSGFEFQVNGDARITNYIEASSATFGNTTLTGFLRGPGTFTIDPAAHGDDTGTVVIAGNLQVDGTTTTINSTTVSMEDVNLTLASGSVNAAASDGAGLTIDVGTNSPTIADATFLYTSSNDTWALNKTLTTSGNLQTAGHSFWRGNGVTSGAGIANGFSPTTSATGASTLSTGSHYVYRLTTTGTGTNSGATYIVWYEDDISSWKARAVSLAGNTSNHPLLDVTSSGTMTIYTNHSSVYGINYTVERVSTVEPDGLAHSLGEFYNWQRLADDIFYTDGNVGIGTDSPNQLLEIQGSTPGLRIHANDLNSAPNPKIELVRGTSSTFGGDAYTDWRLEVQNDARFRITSHDSTLGENVRFIIKHDTGNTGIGTDGPGSKLDVNDAGVTDNAWNTLAKFRPDLSDQHAEASIHIQSYPSTTVVADRRAGIQSIDDAGNARALILNKDGGLVGISTDSPTSKLTINSGISSSSDTVIDIHQATNGADKQVAGIGVLVDNGGETTNAGGMFFQTASGGSLSERMRLTSSGGLELGYSGAARQQADSQAFSIITPASGGGQGIALKRLDSNNDQQLGEISWSNNTQDGLGGIIMKTTGAVNSTMIRLQTSNAGTVEDKLLIMPNGDVAIGVSQENSRGKLHVHETGVTEYTTGTLGLGSIITSGHDGIMELLSVDDNSTWGHALTFKRYRNDDGALQSGFGFGTWTNIGNQAVNNDANTGNTFNRISLTHGTNTWPQSNDELMSWFPDGRVGVNTNSVPANRRMVIARPTEQADESLELRVESGISNNNYDGIRFTQGATGQTFLAGQKIHYYATGVVDMAFSLRNDTNALYLKSGGNVGISHSNPSAGLHIKKQGRNFSQHAFYDGYESDNGLGGTAGSIVGSQVGERTHSLILESDSAAGEDVGASIGFRARSSSGGTLGDVTYGAIVGAKENSELANPNGTYDEQSQGYLGFYTSAGYTFSPHYGTLNYERMRLSSGGNLSLGTQTDQPMSDLFSFRNVVDAGTALDGIAAITNNTSAAELVTLKKNATNNFGGVIHKFAGNSGSALKIERSVNTTTGASGTVTSNIDVDGQLWTAKSGDWLPIGMTGVTTPSTKFYNGGNGFDIQTAGNHYAGLRTRSDKYKYVRIEADLMSAATDHWGVFWHADGPDLGLSNGRAGYKTVYRGNNNRPEFRTIDGNNTFATFDPLAFAYNDGNFHRWVVEVLPTGVTVHVDGELKGWISKSFSNGQGYCGFHTYNSNGPLYVRNACITSLDARAYGNAVYNNTHELAGAADGVYKMVNGAGVVQEVYVSDGWMLVAANDARDSTFPLGQSRHDLQYTVNRNSVMGHLGEPSPDNDYLIGGFLDDFSFSKIKVEAWGWSSTNSTYNYANQGDNASAEWSASSLTTVVPRSSVTVGGNFGISTLAAYFTGDGIRVDYNNGGFNANANQTTIGGVGTQGSSGDPATGCYMGHGTSGTTQYGEGWYRASGTAADSQGYATWVKS